MKRHSRFITAILTIIFALTAGAAITAYASESDGEEGGNPPQESYVDPHPQESDYEPPQESDYDPPQESDYDPPQESGDYDPPQESDYEPEPYYPGESSGSSGESSHISYYDSEGRRYDNPSDVYVGGNQTYIPPSVTPSTTAALYDTSKTKIDDSTLSNSDWADIKNRLANPENASKAADSGDFAFIQNNTSTADNGHWMLILGFSLIALSIAGFIYLISASVSRRKRAALARSGAGGTSQATRYAENPYKQKDEYSDDFGTEKSPKAPKAEKKSKKSKNGRRYK